MFLLGFTLRIVQKNVPFVNGHLGNASDSDAAAWGHAPLPEHPLRGLAARGGYKPYQAGDAFFMHVNARRRGMACSQFANCEHALKCQQGGFVVDAAAVAGDGAMCAHDAVAGDNYADRIPANRAADRLCGHSCHATTSCDI